MTPWAISPPSPTRPTAPSTTKRRTWGSTQGRDQKDQRRDHQRCDYRERQRRESIPAWGNAPGSGPDTLQGLKARTMVGADTDGRPSPPCAAEWIAPMALKRAWWGRFPGALPQAGIGRAFGPKTPKALGSGLVIWTNWLDRVAFRCSNGPVARPLRIERAGGRFHVTARGNERKEVFREDTDRFHFLELLSELGERFSARPAATRGSRNP